MSVSPSDSPPDPRHGPASHIAMSRRTSRQTLASVRGGSADLATTLRRPVGQLPPPLIGATTTLLRNKLYIVGGKNALTSRHTNDIHSLDLDTLVYERVFQDEGDIEAMDPRYFHTTCAWRDSLVIFGGMGPAEAISPTLDDEEDDEALPSTEPALKLFGDLRLYNTVTHTWSSPAVSLSGLVLASPPPRYAHIASVTSSGLLIIAGGQTLSNGYVNEMALLDLEAMAWRECGEPTDISRLGASRAFFTSSSLFVPPSPHSLSSSAPYSSSETPPLYLFSNSLGSTNAHRTLHTLHAPSATLKEQRLTPSHLAPPSLRFPRGEVIGRHLLVTGIASSSHATTFETWTLDLHTHDWQRLATGRVVSSGSWMRSCVWRNKLVLLGDAEGDLALDFHRRQLSFCSLAMIDLEAFGVYQPPRLALSPIAQELALEALSQPALADFVLVCSDRRRLGCSRRILEDRWPWLRERLAKLQGSYLRCGSESEEDDELEMRKRLKGMTLLPRVTARSCELEEDSAVVLPALRYFYTLTLPAGLSVDLLASLLGFAHAYTANHLRSLVVHALHVCLEHDASTAAAVHEAAAVGRCTSLQLRALSLLPQRQDSPSTPTSPTRTAFSSAPPSSLPLDIEATPRATSTIFSSVESTSSQPLPPSSQSSYHPASSSSTSEPRKVTISASSRSAAGPPPTIRLPSLASVPTKDWNAPVKTPKRVVSDAVGNFLGLKREEGRVKVVPVVEAKAAEQRVYYTGRGGAGKVNKPAKVKEAERLQRVNREEATLRAAGISSEVEIALWRLGELEGKGYAKRARAAVEEATAALHEQQHGEVGSVRSKSSAGRKLMGKASMFSLR